MKPKCRLLCFFRDWHYRLFQNFTGLLTIIVPVWLGILLVKSLCQEPIPEFDLKLLRYRWLPACGVFILTGSQVLGGIGAVVSRNVIVNEIVGRQAPHIALVGDRHKTGGDAVFHGWGSVIVGVVTFITWIHLLGSARM